MKKRLGFVSNSSSSSFCILGVWLDKEQFTEKYKSIVGNRDAFDVYTAGIENQEDTVNVGYIDMEEDIKGIFSWDKKVFVGIDVMDNTLDSLMQKTSEIEKKLNMKKEDITVRGWGYYKG